MDETQAAIPLATAPTMPELEGQVAPSAWAAPPMPIAEGGARLPHWAAAIEILLISGIPTQLIIFAGLVFAFDMPFWDTDGMPLSFFATLSLIDTAAIALLIRVFLWQSGETSADMFIGAKPVWGELWRGLALVPVVMVLVTMLVLLVRTVAPWTHSVDTNPMAKFMSSPLDALIFAVVVVLAGGVREELQRAFVLRRFEQSLGGIRIGLAIFTLVFGALHATQGIDVAIAVGFLGLFWGVLYVKRRSAVMAMANHAGFDAAQVLQGLLVKSIGG